MFGSETAVETAINEKCSVVIDTSVLFDYLRAIAFPEEVKPGSDLLVIKTLISQFGNKYITSHVLAEIGTAANSRFRDNDSKRQLFLNRSKGILLDLNEEPIGKNDVLQHECFEKFGVCDIGVMLFSRRKNCYLLMADSPAESYGKKNGFKIISVGELRAHYLTYCK